MKEIIHALKYERRRSIAPGLATLMRESGGRVLCDADAVVPVPLHWRRQYDRGFNQAHDLAIHLGPPVIAMLERTRSTHTQIELPKEQRQNNVRGAFSLRPGTFIQLPRIVVLIDDVATTGATLDSCARVLQRAGVQEVRALTAARVVSGR